MPTFKEMLEADNGMMGLKAVTKAVIRRLVAEAIEANQQKPISVHNRLPAPGQRVLWWNVPLNEWLIGPFCPSNDYPPGYFTASVIIGYIDKHVTHWTPLPQPPTELDT